MARSASAANLPASAHAVPLTIEDIFGVPHLGDAAMPQVKPFGSDVFTSS